MGADRRSATRALIVILLVHFGVVAALHGFFVQTAVGQRIDALPQLGGIGSISILVIWLEWSLRLLGPLSVIVCGLVVVLLLIKGRWRSAPLVAFVALGANLSTQILKLLLNRPILNRERLGRTPFDYPDLQTFPSSLPSGHVTAVAAATIVVIMVAPRGWRLGMAIGGTALMALTGLAVLQVGWHRVSDVIAAFLVVGFWVTLGRILEPRSDALAPALRRTALVPLALSAVGMIILVVAGLTTDPSVAIQQGWLATIAYLGGAAAIIGSALMLLALSLSTCAGPASRMWGRASRPSGCKLGHSTTGNTEHRGGVGHAETLVAEVPGHFA